MQASSPWERNPSRAASLFHSLGDVKPQLSVGGPRAEARLLSSPARSPYDPWLIEQVHEIFPMAEGLLAGEDFLLVMLDWSRKG